MGLIFERVFTDGLAQLSYIVGDDKSGQAVVVDPRRDVAVYLDLAQRLGLKFTHVIETHIHADFVSGAHELHKQTGAEICGGDGEYEFDLTRLKEGDEVDLGAIKLSVISTPGHTPEHISLLIFDAQQGDAPVGVLTGDTLFNLDVGRPDLLGEGVANELAEKLHASLFQKLVPLGDRIEVYPCHGAGSACGKSIGDRVQTTIGNECLYSPALEKRSVEAFKHWLLADMPPTPEHYAHLKRVNAAGAPLTGGMPLVSPMTPAALDTAADDVIILDCRTMLGFGGGHIAGAINIALGPEFPTWAGRMLPYDREVILVAEGQADVAQAVTHLYRIGHDSVSGFLRSGMTSWQNEGRPLSRVDQWTVHELDRRRDDNSVLVLDVRTEQEWEKGHVPGAQHIFVAELADRVSELDADKLVAVYCGSGYRASIAASVLKRHGIARVANVPGSWTAWQNANLPVEK